ncbi:MAG: 50S ribosomal protein L13 [Acidobacteriota bacterium]
MNRTYFPRHRDIQRRWWVVDAKDEVLGRLASAVAKQLRGKTKPQFTPFLDTGDFVVVVNAERIVLTGNKADSKMYYRHSGYPGGLKSQTAKELLRKNPPGMIRGAVRGMLPHNRLGRQLLRKLKVYAGSDHPHQAQQPMPMKVRGSTRARQAAVAGGAGA